MLDLPQPYRHARFGGRGYTLCVQRPVWISSQASDLRGQDQIKSSQNDAIDGLVKYYEDDGIPAEIVAFVCGNTSSPTSGLRKL